MPLDPEQALDEATHRKVEGALDCLRIAARQVKAEAEAIRDDGGEERLASLLEGTSDQLAAMLKQLMSEAYFPPAAEAERAALEDWKRSLPAAEDSGGERERDEQESLFGESEEGSLAA